MIFHEFLKIRTFFTQQLLRMPTIFPCNNCVLIRSLIRPKDCGIPPQLVARLQLSSAAEANK